LVVVIGLTGIDTAVVLWAPAFARPAASLSIVIAWLVVVVVAYSFGMWPGILAAVLTSGFDAAISRTVQFETSLFSFLTMLSVQSIVAAVIGRLRELARRVKEQSGTLDYRERRFHALTEHATDLIVVLGKDGRPTFASPSHLAVLGYSPDAVLAGALRAALSEASVRRLDVLIARALRGSKVEGRRIELRIRHADGTPRVLEVTARNSLGDDAVNGIVLCGRDVTERRRAEQSLVSQALRDPLTGLPNRKQLRAQLDQELEFAARSNRSLAVLFIDLDRFKDVNDALGHHWGDALLCEVASRLKVKMRDGDMVARLGGDEFAVLLPGHGVSEATTVAERIVEALVAPYRIAGQTLVVGASLGISVSSEETDASTLLRQADIAMYVAKRNGSSISVFSVADDQEAQRRLSNATALHDAIANDRLVLCYQPQIGFKTGSVIGVEALLRWNHPDRGLLSPDAFLPLAQEIGMMGPVTDWVLRTSLKQIKRWRNLGHEVRLAVNLSAHDFQDARLPNTLTRLLALNDVAPAQLCLELNETTLSSAPDQAAELLERLASVGVRLSIDDFGTGYTAPGQLKRYPIDELKIDRTFIRGMLDDPQDATIVGAAIDLGHKLGLDIVIEGIEDEPTWHEVIRLGADVGQGNFIGRPQPAEELEAWLKQSGGRAAASLTPPVSATASVSA
jgi:diguanylate cyclase (GGDEF)-like protein/PAS domain S-box-containing protein